MAECQTWRVKSVFCCEQRDCLRPLIEGQFCPSNFTKHTNLYFSLFGTRSEIDDHLVCKAQCMVATIHSRNAILLGAANGLLGAMRPVKGPKVPNPRICSHFRPRLLAIESGARETHSETSFTTSNASSTITYKVWCIWFME